MAGRRMGDIDDDTRVRFRFHGFLLGRLVRRE
jgi:hypothetical protein